MVLTIFHKLKFGTKRAHFELSDIISKTFDYSINFALNQEIFKHLKAGSRPLNVDPVSEMWTWNLRFVP